MSLGLILCDVTRSLGFTTYNNTLLWCYSLPCVHQKTGHRANIRLLVRWPNNSSRLVCTWFPLQYSQDSYPSPPKPTQAHPSLRKLMNAEIAIPQIAQPCKCYKTGCTNLPYIIILNFIEMVSPTPNVWYKIVIYAMNPSSKSPKYRKRFHTIVVFS